MIDVHVEKPLQTRGDKLPADDRPEHLKRAEKKGEKRKKEREKKKQAMGTACRLGHYNSTNQETY